MGAAMQPSTSDDVNASIVLDPIPLDNDDDINQRSSSLLSNLSHLSNLSRFSFGSLFSSRGSGRVMQVDSNRKSSTATTNERLSTSIVGGRMVDNSGFGTNVMSHNRDMVLSSRSIPSLSASPPTGRNMVLAEQWTLLDVLQGQERRVLSAEFKPILNEFSNMMDRIPLHERDRGTQDLYGVSPIPPVEDPVQLQRWLDEMDGWLTRKAVHDHPALKKAISINRKYVQDERIVFLRSEDWNPQRAAIKMGKYYDLQDEFFGSHTLGRDVTFDDMKGDLEYWRMGFLQLLEERDRSGRPVVIIFGKMQLYHVPVETVVSIVMTMAMTMR